MMHIIKLIPSTQESNIKRNQEDVKMSVANKLGWDDSTATIPTQVAESSVLLGHLNSAVLCVKMIVCRMPIMTSHSQPFVCIFCHCILMLLISPFL